MVWVRVCVIVGMSVSVGECACVGGVCLCVLVFVLL